MKTDRQQKGFTLVEIAVVLVIIGLLLGGALKGQQMIENTRIKRIKHDFDQYVAAFYGYQDRYRALPGDDSRATSYLQSVAGLSNGNGNGSISEQSEPTQFWLHLRAASLIPGIGATAPQHALGGSVDLVNGGAGLSGAVLCFANIAASIAGIIDAQYDDGVGSSGSIRGRTATNAAADFEDDSFADSLCFAL